ncbi:MAG: hypothetical protein EAS52_08690 [Parapedobacter sp.]|nr:MAG: hypothetical protein EAS52_08690 [Parapedobacter sp.]
MKRLFAGIICLLLGLLNACSGDDVEIEPDKTQKEIVLTFSAKLPGVSQEVKTYALNPANENSLEAINDGDFTPLPIWAAYHVDDGIDENLKEEIGTASISFLRCMARIDVINQAISDGFTLTEVYVYNSNTKGLIIPKPEYVNGGDNSVSRESLPVSADPNPIPLKYQLVGSNELKGEIYLFEAEAGDDDATPSDPAAIALVVGGHYGNPDEMRYYRIDFKNADGDLSPILRNHRYIINIGSANIDGATNEDDPDHAFNRASMVSIDSYIGFSGIKPAPSKLSSYTVKSTPGLQYTVTVINELD